MAALKFRLGTPSLKLLWPQTGFSASFPQAPIRGEEAEDAGRSDGMPYVRVQVIPRMAQGQVELPGMYRALVIGCNSYTGTAFGSLRTCVQDAEDMAQTLSRNGYVVRSAVDVDRAAMECAINRFTDDLCLGCTAVFFFSGHGISCDGQNFLVPIDGGHVSQCVSLEYIMERMYQRLQAGVVIILLDACRLSASRLPSLVPHQVSVWQIPSSPWRYVQRRSTAACPVACGIHPASGPVLCVLY